MQLADVQVHNPQVDVLYTPDGLLDPAQHLSPWEAQEVVFGGHLNGWIL
jgi:hypothetical protein